MKAEDVNIEASWRHQLRKELESPYFEKIRDQIKARIASGARILPPGKLIFNAFERTPWKKVKVVILGQDPYHRIGQAMGLSFSVPQGVRIPPSLKNIYQELHNDVGISIPQHGDLTLWAEQGVLLLNAMLTVEEGQAGAHKNIGWQSFTDGVIKTLSKEKEGLVFMLWGGFAKSKRELIDGKRHLILEAAHPSPLARGAFFSSKHFSKCNLYLKDQGVEAINWQIP